MMRCDTLVQDICRTCLSVTSVSNLFQAICSDLPVVELLEKCIHHQPTVNDGLPPNMCITCMTSLYQTYVFISMCHRSMNILNGFAETQRQNINAPTSANEVKQEQDLIDEEITEIKFAEVQKLQDSSASAVDTELSVSTPIPESNADLEHEIKEELMIDETSEEATSPEPECSPYTCRFCDLSFTLFDDVLWHFQSKHGSSMSCILCTKTYQSERFAEYHIHSHGPKTYSCFPCRMNFRSEEELNLHKDSSEHVNRKMCPDCGKQFNTPGQLGVHKQTHTRDIKFICSECGHGFMYKSSYNRHLKIHAQKEIIRGTPGKYKNLTIEQKCEIIKFVEKGRSKVKLAKKYGVSKSAISFIVKQKNQYILKNPSAHEMKTSKKRTRVDNVKNSPLEQVLIEWIKQKRTLGISVSGPQIMTIALFFNEKLGGPSSFKASEGWLNKFKKRHGIRRISAADKEAAEFKEEFKGVIERQYNSENVYSGDESGLYSKSLPKNKYNRRNTNARL